MTRLLEPYRLEHTIRVVYVGACLAIPGAHILYTGKGPDYFTRGVPRILTAMLKAHGAVDVKVRRLENTQFIEAILSIQKAG